MSTQREGKAEERGEDEDDEVPSRFGGGFTCMHSRAWLKSTCRYSRYVGGTDRIIYIDNEALGMVSYEHLF